MRLLAVSARTTGPHRHVSERDRSRSPPNRCHPPHGAAADQHQRRLPAGRRPAARRRRRSSPCRSTPSRRAARRSGRRRRRVALDATGRYTLLLGATHADGIPRDGVRAQARRSGWACCSSAPAKWKGRACGSRASRMRCARPMPRRSAGARPRPICSRRPRRETASGAATSAAGGDGDRPGAERGQVVLPGHDELPRQVRERRPMSGTPRSTRRAGAVGIGTTTPLDFLHVRFTNTNGAVHRAGGAEPGRTRRRRTRACCSTTRTARSGSSRASTTSRTNTGSTTSPEWRRRPSTARSTS